MRITFDPAKRAKTLEERGLDFTDAGLVFAGATFTFRDDRADYGEDRFVTVGELVGRMVIVVWTPEKEARRVISMRKANEREQTRYRK
jgi:uncharacterized DUF497 family protein